MLQDGMLPGTAAETLLEPGPVRRLFAGFPALRHRNFRLFVVGQGISLVGFWMQSVAQGWLVYRLEGRPLDLGKVAFAGYLPILCLAPFAGVVANVVTVPSRASFRTRGRHALWSSEFALAYSST